ncbi:hypothetical protein BDF20DRAFT_991852 [Mycotypha africana]|uniref:uncharacterized protein n=1 Tax=Mycotypha africana TaxID=64632 RepID=UPI0023003E30|nr:uncharacterized protein BDF20DRAFT_991852 [Mycotypha africana]KAI8967537.1 hypothetical protein BDF20DRAFT_991852 [Mycotypha africana]
MAEGFNIFQTMTITPRSFPRMNLFDIEGERVNVDKLAETSRLILITIKSTACPACPQLLKLLNVFGLDPRTNTFIDPFTSQKVTVEASKKKKDANYIVLCPGTNAEVRNIQIETQFFGYPFVSSEGGADQLVQALKVMLTEHEYLPTILEVSDDATSVSPVSIGRGPGNYFHDYLIQHLFLERCKEEMKGFATLSNAYGCVNQLKRRAAKCKEGNIAPKSIDLNSTLNRKISPAVLPKKAKELETMVKEKNENTNRSMLHILPSELLEMIVYQISDVSSLIKISGVCREFYVAVCSVLIGYIREQISLLKESLPDLEDAISVTEMQLADERLDRWRGHQEDVDAAVSFRELQNRSQEAKHLLDEINRWIENWKSFIFSSYSEELLGCISVGNCIHFLYTFSADRRTAKRRLREVDKAFFDVLTEMLEL